VLRIGTRRSQLALAQANWTAEALRALGHEVELVEMVTSGDRGASPTDKAGLKGLFVAEIVRALQDGDVDIAVHSAKDLPSEDPEGVVVAAVPEREKPWDLLITRDGELPQGAVVGTVSLRRKGQLLRMRPDVEVVDLRGNVGTRLGKVEDGTVHATLLAAAGLSRLGVEPPHAEALSVEEMVPAPGQACLALQTRAGEEDLLAPLDHEPSRKAYTAERRVMDLLGGGCALPLGAFATVADAEVSLNAVVFEPDGSNLVRWEAAGTDPEEVAAEVHAGLLSVGAEEILAKVLP
jgi:hydroxymethylbilane synthase